MFKRSVFVAMLLSAAMAMIAGCGGSEPQLGTSAYESLPDQQRQALTASSSLPISGVVASADDGNVAANVLDGNLSTRWSCNGVGCWIRADLGAQKTVNALGVAWYSGNARTNNFTVSVSNDDVSYTQIFSGTSSGTTLQMESYTLAAIQARYVKLTVNGNSVNNWASVTELQVIGGAATTTTSTSTTPTTTTSGPTYYVAHGGSGTTCSQSAPCGTIAAGIAKLQAGATLYIRGGTSESDPNALWDARVSWGISDPKGTASAPITVSAYPGDTVILKPSTSGSYVWVFSAYGAAGASYGAGCTTGRCSSQVPQYITVRNIIFDGATGTDGAHGVVGDSYALAGGTYDQLHTGAHHITWDGIEIRNGQGQGMQLLGDYGQCLNCNVHDNGHSGSGTHGIYVEGKHWLFNGGAIYNNASTGVHNWTGEDGSDTSDNTYENLEVYNNGTFSGAVGAGIWIACGARNVVKNVYAHDNQQVGVLLNSSAANTSVTNSTFSGNGSGGAGTGLSATNENWAGSMPSGDSASILQPNGTYANYHDFEPGDPQFGGQPYKIGGTYGLIHTGNTGE